MIIQIVLLIGIATLVMIYTTLKGKSKTGGMGGTGPDRHQHINQRAYRQRSSCHIFKEQLSILHTREGTV